MTQFKPFDTVTYNPTGEKWMLISVYGSYVVPAGWPESRALASDCTLICGCTTSDQRDACTRACEAVVL